MTILQRRPQTAPTIVPRPVNPAGTEQQAAPSTERRRREPGVPRSRRLGIRDPATRPVGSAAHREVVRQELARYCRDIDLTSIVARHGTPLFVLDLERIVAQIRELQRELPFVRLHYATKALPHPAVITTVAAAGAGFEVASRGEIGVLQAAGIDLADCLHTHPVKTPADITGAYVAGVRTFVVDAPGEIAKFRGFPPDVRLLVRLSYPNARAASDLSSKFGVPPRDAAALVGLAVAQGTRVCGFSFHVGSQTPGPAPFERAIGTTLRLAASLEASTGLRFDVLDLGGGLPVAYDRPVASLARMAAGIRRALAGAPGRLQVLAEPGRFIAAPAMTHVARVVGSCERADGTWHHLDDGVYGGWSNIPAEGVRAPIFAGGEVLPGPSTSGTDARTALAPAARPRRPVTLAGPTCDSVDVVARRLPLPELSTGDLVVTPMMGAYTAVTATAFNGLRPPRVVVLD